MVARPRFYGTRFRGRGVPRFYNSKLKTGSSAVPRFYGSRIDSNIANINPGFSGIAYSYDTVLLMAFVDPGPTLTRMICEQLPKQGVPAVTIVGNDNQIWRTYKAPATFDEIQLDFKWTAQFSDADDVVGFVSHTIKAHGWYWSGNNAIRGPLISYEPGSWTPPPDINPVAPVGDIGSFDIGIYDVGV